MATAHWKCGTATTVQLKHLELDIWPFYLLVLHSSTSCALGILIDPLPFLPFHIVQGQSVSKWQSWSYNSAFLTLRTSVLCTHCTVHSWPMFQKLHVSDSGNKMSLSCWALAKLPSHPGHDQAGQSWKHSCSSSQGPAGSDAVGSGQETGETEP